MPTDDFPNLHLTDLMALRQKLQAADVGSLQRLRLAGEFAIELEVSRRHFADMQRIASDTKEMRAAMNLIEKWFENAREISQHIASVESEMRGAATDMKAILESQIEAAKNITKLHNEVRVLRKQR